MKHLIDRIEIQDLLTRYCSSIDDKTFERLDTVFVPDAFIDYTSAGGIKGHLPEIKTWLAEALGNFPMTQHLVTNFDIEIDGNEAKSRCAFYNPLGLPKAKGDPGLSLLFCGGYYNDRLRRTDDGWRIYERIEETSWTDMSLPEGFEVPK